MTVHASTPLRVAIACGGTGGHLFPGLAIAEHLRRRACAVTLLISQKEVDQQAVQTASGMQVITLPAIGLTRGGELAFLRSFMRSYQTARKAFKASPPHAVLAMGGFTSAPPVLAAKRSGARTFLHESNTIPGRANRWLSWVVDRAFIGFPSAGARLHSRRTTLTGTPVRPQFQPRDSVACRTALGLDPVRPVLLVMGGSQGAAGINSLVVATLPMLAKSIPELQCFHLTGQNEAEMVRRAYEENQVRGVVHPFFAGMELALAAASVGISRAGASSLAEVAAMRLPAILIPYPAATDDHQLHNARAFQQVGAAHLIEQRTATPEMLAGFVVDLVKNDASRETMQKALLQWHFPHAPEQIAETILESIGNVKICGSEADAACASRLRRHPSSIA